MSNQFCPHCNELRDMVALVHEINKKVEDGKIVKIVTSDYHCIVCNAFVYSTDTKIK